MQIPSIWQLAVTAEYYIHLGFSIACLVLAVTALIKCLPKNAQRFDAAFKRTKGFWTLMTGGACLMALIGLLGAGPFGMLFPVAAACIAAVYLTDVEPEVS